MSEVMTQTREVVINACFGGFGLSHEAVLAVAQRKGITLYPTPSEFDLKRGNTISDALIVHYYKIPAEDYAAKSAEMYAEDGDYRRVNAQDWYFGERDIKRDDPDLIAVVREMGAEANGKYAELKIVEIPADIEWEIDEYGGLETIDEKHRSWR